MSVRDIMEVNVVTMALDAALLDVAKSMNKMDIGSVVIVDQDRPVGIITESDIVRRVIAEERDLKTTKAKDVMSSPLVHVTPNMALTDAMRVMARSNIRRVAVLKNNNLAGIISSRDILRWSPELIDILTESLKLREAEAASNHEDEEEDDLVENGGVCDSCGEYSTELVIEDGRLMCEECRR
jgi:CBS domain-containing protein